MSLLMEALRKVDQERRTAQEEPPSRPLDDDLLALELEVAPAAEAPVEGPKESNLELDPPEEETPGPEPEAEGPGPTQPKPRGELEHPTEPDAPRGAEPTSQALSDEGTTPRPEPGRRTVPAPKAEPQPAGPTEEPDRPAKATASPRSAPSATEDPVREEERQLNRTLARARRQARRARLFKSALALIALAALAAGLGSYFWVQQQAASDLIPAGVGFPADQAVSALPPDGTLALAETPEAETPPQGEAEAASAPPVPSAPADAARGEPVRPASRPPAPAPKGSAVQAAPREASRAPATDGSTPRPAPTDSPAPRPPATARQVYEAAMSRRQGASEAAIEIRRSRPKRGGASPAMAAWRAFQAGDYDQADQAYARILQGRPFDRDALLGRAAVAVAQGRLEAAQGFYLRLLERDPRDPLAQAGLTALRGKGRPVEAIARIKALIATHPELGALHFVLGNLYAAQSRWAYAQQAYFKAHVSDPGNADYLYNLAVSLDHLGKSRQALDYYTRALEQGRRTKAAFSRQAVAARVAALEEVVQ